MLENQEKAKAMTEGELDTWDKSTRFEEDTSADKLDRRDEVLEEVEDYVYRAPQRLVGGGLSSSNKTEVDWKDHITRVDQDDDGLAALLAQNGSAQTPTNLPRRRMSKLEMGFFALPGDSDVEDEDDALTRALGLVGGEEEDLDEEEEAMDGGHGISKSNSSCAAPGCSQEAHISYRGYCMEHFNKIIMSRLSAFSFVFCLCSSR